MFFIANTVGSSFHLFFQNNHNSLLFSWIVCGYKFCYLVIHKTFWVTVCLVKILMLAGILLGWNFKNRHSLVMERFLMKILSVWVGGSPKNHEIHYFSSFPLFNSVSDFYYLHLRTNLGLLVISYLKYCITQTFFFLFFLLVNCVGGMWW